MNPIVWRVQDEDPEDLQDGPAYYDGILFNKRILLSGTFLHLFNSEEITAVVAHELGHWRTASAAHKLAFLEVHTLILILLFQRLYHKSVFYKAFGFYEEQPALIFAFIFFYFIMLPYQLLVTLASNWLEQYDEYRADDFAARDELGESLCIVLLKLGINHTLPMDDDWLYSLSENSHPSTISRCHELLSK